MKLLNYAGDWLEQTPNQWKLCCVHTVWRKIINVITDTMKLFTIEKITLASNENNTLIQSCHHWKLIT